MTKKEGESQTTEFARNEPTRSVGAQAGAAQAGDKTTDEQSIKVRALRTFHKDENMQGDMTKPGDEFDCPRSRAAQLRANGLVEYVNESDGAKLHGEDGAAKLKERADQDAKLREVPDRHKGTPLRNPELKLADVPEDAGKGGKK